MTLQQVIEEQRKKHFPFELGNGFTAQPIALADLVVLVGRLWHDIFGTTNEERGCFELPSSRVAIDQAMHMHYLTTVHHEFFCFKDPEGQELGWFIGEAGDHQTFYLRNFGVIPQVRRQRIFQHFLAKFLTYLEDIGYERVTSEHHPNNTAVLIAMLKSGFFFSGMTLDERTGPLIKSMRLLPQDRKQGFLSVYRLPSY